MTSVLAAFEAQRPQKARVCAVCDFAATLEPEERETLLTILAAKDPLRHERYAWEYAAAARALAALGCEVAPSTVRRHREHGA